MQFHAQVADQSVFHNARILSIFHTKRLRENRSTHHVRNEDRHFYDSLREGSKKKNQQLISTEMYNFCQLTHLRKAFRTSGGTVIPNACLSLFFSPTTANYLRSPWRLRLEPGRVNVSRS